MELGSLHIVDDHGPDTRVLVARGELDMSSAPDVRMRVSAAIEAGKRRVIIDLTEVTYLDSTALAALIDSSQRLRFNGCAFAVVSPRDSRSGAILRVTHLGRMLTLRETREDALASLARRAA